MCREAVVRIAHEKAHELDKAGLGGLGEEIDLTAQLRPVTMDDFAEARKKVSRFPQLAGHILFGLGGLDVYHPVPKNKAHTRYW